MTSGHKLLPFDTTNTSGLAKYQYLTSGQSTWIEANFFQKERKLSFQIDILWESDSSWFFCDVHIAYVYPACFSMPLSMQRGGTAASVKRSK